jgi:hypothetical protein
MPVAPTEFRVGIFLIEFALIFGFSLLSLALIGWRIRRLTGYDAFSNRYYLYAGAAVAVVVAFIRVIISNEKDLGRAFF